MELEKPRVKVFKISVMVSVKVMSMCVNSLLRREHVKRAATCGSTVILD